MTTTSSDLLLEALQEWDVSYIFCNLGSDHPTIIEALAKAKKEHIKVPEIVICPHEGVALYAAQGYTQLTGKTQAVFIHVDVGTQNLGGAVHNVNRAKIPVFIFAGETPYTLEGELPGSRNFGVNHWQNVFDQRGIVRQYVKWEYESRTGQNIKQVTYRAMQIANSEPQGPIYLTAAREVLAEEATRPKHSPEKWLPIEKLPMPDHGVEEVVGALQQADNPLLITSYVGKNEESVSSLVAFCEKLAIPVIEVNPAYMNFPADHPLHLGFATDDFIENADVVVVLDCDTPWLHIDKKPSKDCKVYYIDNDPLKEDIPLWYIPSERFFKVNSNLALSQLNEYVNDIDVNRSKLNERFERLKGIHQKQRDSWKKEVVVHQNGVITSDWLAQCINEVIDEDTILMLEGLKGSAFKHIPRNKPGTLFGSGGSSLGWFGGASIGAKLAKPNKTVVSITGDGTYFFSVPSTTYWVAKQYNAPFLTIIANNGGWNATKANVLKMFPEGIAKQEDMYFSQLDQSTDLAKIAEASGGAYAQKVTDPEQLKGVLQTAIQEVNKGRSAVIEVVLEKISNQSF